MFGFGYLFGLRFALLLGFLTLPGCLIGWSYGCCFGLLLPLDVIVWIAFVLLLCLEFLCADLWWLCFLVNSVVLYCLYWFMYVLLFFLVYLLVYYLVWYWWFCLGIWVVYRLVCLACFDCGSPVDLVYCVCFMYCLFVLFGGVWFGMWVWFGCLLVWLLVCNCFDVYLGSMLLDCFRFLGIGLFILFMFQFD